MSKTCVYDLRLSPRPGATDEAVAVEAAEARRSRRYTGIEICGPATSGEAGVTVTVGMFDGSPEVLAKLRAARRASRQRGKKKGKKRA